MSGEKVRVTKDMTIGEIRALGQVANEIMDGVFGPGCFSCPNSKTKTLEFGASIHGKDPDQVVEELNKRLNEQIEYLITWYGKINRGDYYVNESGHESNGETG